jgi:hypothetical protein
LTLWAAAGAGCQLISVAHYKLRERRNRDETYRGLLDVTVKHKEYPKALIQAGKI